MQIREEMEIVEIIPGHPENQEAEYLAIRQEIRTWLAAADGRFEDWTTGEEPATESSDDMSSNDQESLRSLPEVQLAIEAYHRGECGDEAIIDMAWRRRPNGEQETRLRPRAMLSPLAQPTVWALDQTMLTAVSVISEFFNFDCFGF
jgi:hypothetical protein